MKDQYKKSGVSLDAGYEVVKRIKKHIERTKIPGVIGDIGSFGGLFNLSNHEYKEPVLVSGTDGVGTKLLIAIKLNKHDTIGRDLVAMCVNDIVVLGAKPLFFLDYIAVGKNKPEKIEGIVKGITDGLIDAGCALIGGETAEMPDVYKEDHYDLAGFTVGIVDKDKIITGDKVNAGDVLIGISSSGLHSNGYSLVRKILFRDNHVDLEEEIDGKPLGEILLTPTKIYVKPILKLLEKIEVHGMAHITGGGFYENIPRILKSNLGVEIDSSRIKIPKIFSYLENIGDIDRDEMYHVFNMGIGLVIIVKKEDVETTIEVLRDNGEDAYVIGKVVKEEGVTII